MSLELGCAVSTRGKKLLVVDGFKFSFKKWLKLDNTKLWYCCIKTCRAKIYTCGESDVVVRSADTHNHEKNLQKLARHAVSAACKRKAIEDVAERPIKLIRKEIIVSGQDYYLTTSDVRCCRKNIYNARRQHLPSVPSNRHEVHLYLQNEIVKTHRGENFLFLNNTESGIVAFTCETNLRYMASCPKIYMDGTFAYCSKHFYQLYTIHGLQNGQYIPLVYCLLPDKKRETYEILFADIKIKMQDRYNLIFTPNIFVVDFEVAVHSAIKSIWPETSIRGCRFHLAQAWHRKIQLLGLSTVYKDKNSEIGNWLGNIFGLPFLSPQEVRDCFAYDFYSDKPNCEKIDKFCDYLVETYIREDATFEAEMWAESSASLENTSNCCESFHSRFNDSFYHSHPTIFIFLKNLIDFQLDTYIKIQSVTSTKFVNAKILKAKKFVEYQLLLKSEGKSTYDFVKSVSQRYKPYCQ